MLTISLVPPILSVNANGNVHPKITCRKVGEATTEGLNVVVRRVICAPLWLSIVGSDLQDIQVPDQPPNKWIQANPMWKGIGKGATTATAVVDTKLFGRNL